MTRQEKWLAAITVLLLVVIALLAMNLWLLLGGSNLMRTMPMPMMPMSPLSNSAASNGERIFKTGVNAGGQSIPNSMMTGMGGCSMCHGLDGNGGQMMGRAEPCNTFKCLTARGYSADLIKRAVTQGVAVDGRALDLMMPRWQMSDSDLNDLITYLQSLP